MIPLSPRLDVLPRPQRELWPELAAVPRSFVLYGGTGLALRLGHRVSVDFDFFLATQLDAEQLRRAVPFVASAEVLNESPDGLTISVDRSGPVKVSFFGPVGIGRVGEPELTADGVLRVASLLDLAGTKVKALLQRVEAKDYRDIAALLSAGVPMESILGAAVSLFGGAFNPLVARKTLAYFEGGDLASLDEPTRALLRKHALRDVEARALARLSERLD